MFRCLVSCPSRLPLWPHQERASENRGILRHWIPFYGGALTPSTERDNQ